MAAFYEFGLTEFRFVLENVDELDTMGQDSLFYSTGDIDWHLNLCTHTTEKGKFLSTFLYCTPLNVASAWSVTSQFRIVLENIKGHSITRQKDFVFESEVAERCGWDQFITFDEAADPSYGFLIDEKLRFSVIVGVKSADGFDTPKYFNFFEKGEFSDGTITANCSKYYVNKMILSVHSPVMSKEFELNNDISFEFCDVDDNEFNYFLQILYSVPLRIQRSNVDMIIRLSSHFDTHGLNLSCEQFLKYTIRTEPNDNEWVIKQAEKHDLKSILKYILDSATNADDLKKMFRNFENLSVKTLKAVIKKALSLS